MASTDYYNQPPNIAAPPNPQIAVGPDDVLTIVNRTIARYPNPNAAGNAPVANPYNNPPTSKAWLDTWMGIANLALVCPTVPRSNSTCVIDNASIRYDQMQGRFVVLFTATDVPSHISNFVLVISRYATFDCSVTGNPPPATQPCPNTSDLFTPPIVPIVGGPNTGGVNTYWTMSLIPVNVVLAAGATSRPARSSARRWYSHQRPRCDCWRVFRRTDLVGCTNYFPTGARIGLDNDNIILTAPVLDVSQEVGPTALNPTCTNTATLGCGPVLPGGPFAGTRVVTVPKVVVYNGVALGGNPTNIGSTGTGLVNLSDDTLTGTLTGQANTALSPSPAETCTPQPGDPIPCVFWEPDNLRGRALASFTAQVGPTGSLVAGVLTPIDYLVGRPITNTLGGFDNYPGIWVQPIIFTCPTGAIFPAPAGVTFCGIASGAANPGGGQVAETAVLGVRIDPPTGTAPAPAGRVPTASSDQHPRHHSGSRCRRPRQERYRCQPRQ